jgi:deazaflavin-dependent oxidoreductase (nitroreductase family)
MHNSKHEISGWQRLIQKLSSTKPAAWLLARILHILDRQVLRLTNGTHTLTSLFAGVPVLILTTTGARSGKPRSVPLVGIYDQDSIILIASNYGQAHHPGWYYNLRADPRAVVTTSDQPRYYLSRETEGAERDKYWRMAIGVFPGYAEYEKRTKGRRIPVMVLEPV